MRFYTERSNVASSLQNVSGPPLCQNIDIRGYVSLISMVRTTRLGILKKLIPSFLVLVYIAAMHNFTVFDTSWSTSPIPDSVCTRTHVELDLSPLSDVTCNHAQTGRILGNVGNVEITSIIARFLGSFSR